jgi:uncharacterized protein YciI
VKKYVVLYESADDVASRAPAHFAAHREWYAGFHDRGDLLGIGTFADPQSEGAMAVFASRAAAEEFVADDPFVVNGVVRAWHIREWEDVLA